MKEAWNAIGDKVGTRSIASIVIHTHGVKMGRWLAGQIIKKLTIASCQVPAHTYKRGGNEHVKIPNLLYHQFVVTQPNQVWCGAVTYLWLWTGKCWAYLAVVLDLFARKPVGWEMSLSPD